jgi:hypothetical protein
VEGVKEFFKDPPSSLHEALGGKVNYFSAGTSVIGIRGTDFIMAYLPETESMAVLLREGEVAIEGQEPEVVMRAGSAVLVRDGEAGKVRPLSEAQYQSVVDAEDPLEAIRALGLAGPAGGGGGSVPIGLVVVVAVLAVGTVGVLITRVRSGKAA